MDDRRGIYTELTGAGLDLLARARPIHDSALLTALSRAEGLPEFVPLVDLFRNSAPAGSDQE